MRTLFLPPLISAFYWLWSSTWRFEVIEHPDFTTLRKKGSVSFAHWHGDEMVVLRLGPRYKCAAMTSTSKDGELMTRVLKYFGFGISRGSSTRGGARALLGMVKLVESGYNATVAVDGPKGPRHKVKPGVWYLAKHAQTPVVPTGVARQGALVFHKSWNKTYLPWPFAKVIVYFDKPLDFPEAVSENNIAQLEGDLEYKLHIARGKAQALLLGRPLDEI
ncbi:MAG: lysophospholipid acyltransferase family protein [Oligoflexia bacterium]|nr:lysophospholipid acyltransferase family protein [Oligoflexia bacterium]